MGLRRWATTSRHTLRSVTTPKTCHDSWFSTGTTPQSALLSKCATVSAVQDSAQQIGSLIITSTTRIPPQSIGFTHDESFSSMLKIKCRYSQCLRNIAHFRIPYLR